MSVVVRSVIMMLFVATILRIVHEPCLAEEKKRPTTAPSSFLEFSGKQYVSKRTGWVQKMVIFAKFQHCINAGIVGGSKSQKIC